MPAQFIFHVTFFNNTGLPSQYARWRALIYRPGEKRSFGNALGTNKTIPTGITEQDTGIWQVRVLVCEDFYARAVWEDAIGTQTLFVQPNGESISIPFKVCP